MPYVAKLTRWRKRPVKGYAVMLNRHSKLSAIVPTYEEANEILLRVLEGPHYWVRR